MVLARSSPRDPIASPDVSAELLDEDGEAMELTHAPSGTLLEVGGRQSRSAQAAFCFRPSVAAPDAALVRYRGRTARFALVPQPDGPEFD